MTTASVVGLTDELVAELESLANECGQHGTNWYEPRHMASFPEYACDQDFVIAASPATILALLSERAELKRDAERYRWLRMADWWDSPLCVVKDPKTQAKPGTDCPSRDRLDTAIDAAMQSEAKHEPVQPRNHCAQPCEVQPHGKQP